MDEAARICARLIVAGAVARKELPEIDHPAIRTEVEERLSRCGLTLTTSAYSDHVGLQLDPATSDPSVLDEPSNLGLPADACALLTVLWARLALQRRTAEDTRDTPDAQRRLLPDEPGAAARRYSPSVRFETLRREFGAQLGGRVRLKALLGRLRRLGFVRYARLDAIEAGPLLELGIDGERMVAFIRSRVLGRLLEARAPQEIASEPSAAPDTDAAERLISVLASDGPPASIGDLEQRTGIPRRQLRQALAALRAEGRVEKLGNRGDARYRAVPARMG
jgi:hypothetical protein